MKTEAQEWMTAVWSPLGLDHIIEVSLKTKSGQWKSVHSPLADAIEAAGKGTFTKFAEQGNDVYAGLIGLSKAPDGPGKRGSSSLRDFGACIWMDVDCVAPGRSKQNLFETVEDAIEQIDSAGRYLGIGPADVVVHSGWGVHVAWLLSEPAPANNLSAAVRMVENTLSSLTGKHVDHVGDVTRVLRIPGTFNRRGEDAKVTLVRCDTSNRRTWESLKFSLGLSDEMLNRVVSPVERKDSLGGYTKDNRPLMDIPSLFEATTKWSDVLTPFGWTLVSSNDREDSWLRPGKEDDRSTGERSGVVYADTPGLMVLYTDAPTGLNNLRMTDDRAGAGSGCIDRWRAWVDLMWDGDFKSALEDASKRAFDAEGDLGTWPDTFIDELTQEYSLGIRWAQKSRVAAVDLIARGL